MTERDKKRREILESMIRNAMSEESKSYRNDLIDQALTALRELDRVDREELTKYKQAVNEIMNIHEIDSYIFKVHNKGKYSIDAKNGYNECIRDTKRILSSILNNNQMQ